MLAPEEYKKLAGLVPLPEAGSKENVNSDLVDTGPQALTEAAKEAIRKAARKRAQESESKENEDSVSDEEDAESSES